MVLIDLDQICASFHEVRSLKEHLIREFSEVYQLCLNALMRYNTVTAGLSQHSYPPLSNFTHENMLGNCPHIVLWGVVDHLLILLQMRFSFILNKIKLNFKFKIKYHHLISYTSILFRQSTGNVVVLCFAFGFFLLSFRIPCVK